jgi:agmatine deiminase
MKSILVRLLLIGSAVIAPAHSVYAQSLDDLIAPSPSDDLEPKRAPTSPWDLIKPLDQVQPTVSPAAEAQRNSGRAIPAGEPLGILPAEFEHQQAMLLACDPLVDSLPDMFVEIVRRLSGRTQIIALVDGAKGRANAMKLLADRKIASSHVHFVNLRHNSMWARDFGPHAVRRADGHWSLVDAIYTSPDRSADDGVPAALGKALNRPVASGELRVDGGNLLVNGKGLLVATSSLAKRNLLPGVEIESIRNALGEFYGAREVVFLEPLVGEPTTHVDMFATFTSADTVVVGQLDAKADPENAAVLDRNAIRLASQRVNGKRLRVVRIPMPRHDDAIWRTFTNVVYANGLLLVPTCTNFDKTSSEIALATYRRLLPAWRVEAIDAEPLLALGGAMHCVTMNLGSVERLPAWDDEVSMPVSEGEGRLDGPRRIAPAFEVAPSDLDLQLFGNEASIRSR